MLLKRVILIGAGNLGWHLGKRLLEQGIPVVQVYSRLPEHARALADILRCPSTSDLEQMQSLDQCLYLLAIKDDAIASVAEQLKYLSHSRRVFAHTSGAVASEVLRPFFQHYGVLYPLQTFSKVRAVDFERVPVCVYAPEQAVSAALLGLAERISGHVASVDDEKRKALHVAAVIVNNFTNHLFGIGKELVEQESLSFDLLRPLITETIDKIMDHDPAEMQTGPARRKDQQTIVAHLRYLQPHPEWQSLYRLISHTIAEKYRQL